LSNQKRLYWRSLAAPNQTCTSHRCTELSGAQAVLRLARPVNWLLSGKVEGATAKIHRIVWCAPDCSVSQPRPRQRSAARSAGDTWTSPMVRRSHRTVWCATGAVSATVGFTSKGRKLRTVHCLVVHPTVRCAHEQKATMAFQMELQRLLIAFGL
jgi:hypothetical protein